MLGSFCLAFLPTLTLMLMVTLMLLGSSLAASASGSSSNESGADDRASIEPVDIIPDIAVFVSAVDGNGPVESVLAALSEVEGVDRVMVDGQIDGGTVFYLADDGPGPTGPDIDRMLDDVEQRLVDGQGLDVSVGGGAVVDRQLQERFGGSVISVIVLAAAVGIAVGLRTGPAQAAILALTLGLAVAVAGNLGGQVADGFHGTMDGSGLGPALAGLGVGSWLCLRLVAWFRSPAGNDGADMIRRSIADVAPELALVLTGSLAAALFLGLVGTGTTAVLAATVGAAVAAMVVLAAATPALVMLTDRYPPTATTIRPLPDGRDLALPALAGVLFVLLLLGLPLLRGPATDLADHRDLPEGSRSAGLAEQLLLGGDPTRGVALAVPVGPEPAAIDRWVRTLADVEGVGWVDTATVRVFPGGRTDAEVETIVPASVGDRVALVVPAVEVRSEPGRAMVEDLSSVSLPGGQPELVGAAVGADRAAGSTGLVLVAVAALAVAAAIAVGVVTQHPGLAVLALVLRLLAGVATAGLVSLVADRPPMAATLTALTVLAMVAGVWEIEFVRRRYGPPGEPAIGTEPVGRRGPDRHAVVATAVLAVAGLVLVTTAPFGGGPGVGRFGLALAVAAMVELVLLGLILRPALIGQRAAYHSAVRPVRVAFHSGADRSQGMPEDPTWRRVVVDLIQSEFRLQVEPERAELGSVFVEHTPLYRQAAEHHDNMAGAGLRVAGRSPRLRSLKTLSGRRPVKLAVTVDHPIRQLVDSGGKVVGVRKAERRSGVLWLVEEAGSYRIAESVDLGSVFIEEGDPLGVGGGEGENGDGDGDGGHGPGRIDGDDLTVVDPDAQTTA